MCGKIRAPVLLRRKLACGGYPLELMIGLEPTTYALPRRCATDCATSAPTLILYMIAEEKSSTGRYFLIF